MKTIKTPTRLLCDGMKGQNYWLHGSMEYLMECLGAPKDYDYWFFSGISGDSFTQVFTQDMERCIVSYAHNCFDDKIAATMFHSCGYDYQYISDITDDNRNLYLNRIQEYIDNNIPVLCRGGKDKLEFCVIYGYDGEQLSYLICDNEQPRQLPYDFTELIFVGEKKYETNLAKSYRDAVMNIPNLIQMPEINGIYCGREAFLNWSNSYQDSTYDNVTIEDINVWNVHGVYLMISGTNGCSRGFLKKALELNPDMLFLDELETIYKKHGDVFEILAYRNKDGVNDYQNGGLEGGFNITSEAIKDKNRMKKISDTIMKSVKYCDEILEVFSKF